VKIADCLPLMSKQYLTRVVDSIVTDTSPARVSSRGSDSRPQTLTQAQSHRENGQCVQTMDPAAI
jgi:hypothetical protein